MKNIITYIFILLGLFVFVSCEDDIQLDVPEGPKRLVVEGSMTTSDGPQKVKLTQTYDYNDNEDAILFVSNATVNILDDQGNTYPLTYTNEGIYETEASVKGVVGREYTLQVLTVEGQEYKSTAQEMKIVTPIDTLTNYHKEELVAGDFFELGYFAAIEFYENEGYGDYYRWKLYVNDSLQNGEENITVQSDEQLSDGVQFTEDDFVFQGRALDIGDVVYVEQIAITSREYEFWEELLTQLRNDGGPFDTPPAPIRGNMFNVNDDKEVVIGFFGTHNITKSNTMIVKDRGFETQSTTNE